jgi:hypothetical protein
VAHNVCGKLQCRVATSYFQMKGHGIELALLIEPISVSPVPLQRASAGLPFAMRRTHSGNYRVHPEKLIQGFGVQEFFRTRPASWLPLQRVDYPVRGTELGTQEKSHKAMLSHDRLRPIAVSRGDRQGYDPMAKEDCQVQYSSLATVHCSPDTNRLLRGEF